jgi:hypothetical protein
MKTLHQLSAMEVFPLAISSEVKADPWRCDTLSPAFCRPLIDTYLLLLISFWYCIALLLMLFCFIPQRVTVTLKRGGDKGLGFSIAGGRGSTPYKDGDPVSTTSTVWRPMAFFVICVL